MLRPLLRLSALLVVLACSITEARADFLYATSGLPAPMVSGQSFVAFLLNPSPVQTLPLYSTSVDLILANVVGFSTNVTGGDSFNTPFVLKIDFSDPAHPGSDAVTSFTGTLAGKLGAGQSSLFLQFAAQTTNIDLAGNPYAVSMPTTSIPVSGNGSQNPFGVHVEYIGLREGLLLPEPSALLLAAFGVPLLGLMRRRKRALAASGQVLPA